MLPIAAIFYQPKIVIPRPPPPLPPAIPTPQTIQTSNILHQQHLLQSFINQQTQQMAYINQPHTQHVAGQVQQQNQAGAWIALPQQGQPGVTYSYTRTTRAGHQVWISPLGLLGTELIFDLLEKDYNHVWRSTIYCVIFGLLARTDTGGNGIIFDLLWLSPTTGSTSTTVIEIFNANRQSGSTEQSCS